MAEPLFRFEQVVLEADGKRILDGVDTIIPVAGVTALVGPSGSGKSTLLRLCNRLEVPTGGCVRFRGVDLADVDPLTHRRRVGMVFQRPTLFAGTVRENLQVAEPSLADDAAVASLESVGLDATYLDRVGDQLSGGEAQRACLARTLVTEPEVVLMDEVTSSLDEDNTAILEQLACDLADRNIPVLWVSHDPAQVRRISSHVISMRNGRVTGIDHPTPSPEHHRREESPDAPG